MKRQQREFMGRRAEDMACEWLIGRGWQILDRRRKTPLGEVDIVAMDGNCLVFVEVKWRKSADNLTEAVPDTNFARIAAAGEILAGDYVDGMTDRRIDVVLLAPGAPIRHIANAWQP